MKHRDSKLAVTLSLCFLSNILCFLDRVNISIAAPFIMQSYGWNETQMGLVFSAFFAGYVIFMIPGGVMADRFGAHKVLTAGVGFWSFFTLITPFFHRIWSMSLCRYMIGTGQAVNFPCVSNLIACSVPPAHRAKAMGFILSGITIGSFIGMPLAAWIIKIWNWQAVFYVFGIIGFVWILFWIWCAPEDRPVNADSVRPGNEKIPWKLFLTNRSSLGLAFSYFCHNYAGYFLLVWLPTYLVQVYDFSITGVGIGAAIPALASGVFMNLSGWASDYLIKKGKTKEFSRKILLYPGMSVSGLLLVGLIWVSNPFIAVALITLSSAAKAIATPAYWALTVDIAPRNAGVLSSIMNTSGNVAGVIASALTGWMVAMYSSWNPAIILSGIITVLGVVIAVPTIRSSEIT